VRNHEIFINLKEREKSFSKFNLLDLSAEQFVRASPPPLNVTLRGCCFKSVIILSKESNKSVP